MVIHTLQAGSIFAGSKYPIGPVHASAILELKWGFVTLSNNVLK